ncbi:MAG: hypothetical protein M1497_08820 [Nitrospirae bacterium]|nr:hypothetical protein [Nitrospirota bacterium]
MKEHCFENEASEEARSQYLSAIFLRAFWTSLTIVALLGALVPLTIVLGWGRLYLSCLLGLLTGFSIAAGLLSSPKSRALITLLLGVLTLPGFAIFLTLMAASSVQALEASSEALTPFVVHALAALVGGLIIVRIWQKMPVMNQKETLGKESSSM